MKMSSSGSEKDSTSPSITEIAIIATNNLIPVKSRHMYEKSYEDFCKWDKFNHMSWFTDLAGRAESLLNNLDEQTGQALRNHNVKKTKQDKNLYPVHPNTLYTFQPEAENSWIQRNRRPIPRNMRQTIVVNDTKSTYPPTRKGSPTRSRALFKDGPAEPLSLRPKKSSPRRQKPPSPYNLNNCPATLVNDELGGCDFNECIGPRQRRRSVPSDLDLVMTDECDIPIRIQNLEVENAMLKNELNVMNREISMMLGRLKTTEEGNNVDSNRELGHTRVKLQSSELEADKAKHEKDSLDYQLKMLKDKIQEIAVLEKNYRGEKQAMATENSALKEANNYLEDRVNDLKSKLEESNETQHKMETDLRHAQSTIIELQEELEKSRAESQRLEKDWDTYKLRVKSMLAAKDSEIKALQDGINFSEEAKQLVEQIDSLKMERDELSEAICTVRSECDGMRLCLSQVESRHTAAERVVAALRDALKEERCARNRAESQLFAMSKEMKNMQTETGQTIASLRTALRDKETELNHVRDAVSTNFKSSSDTSALNVADYDVTQDTIEKEKIHYLTETLVQKQARVDKLLSENNMLKIQMDKLESRLKKELLNRTSNHSLVNVQQAEGRARRVYSGSLLNMVSNRMAVVIKRHPAIRIFAILYMICLHFWVLTVLLTSTPPENFLPNISRT